MEYLDIYLKEILKNYRKSMNNIFTIVKNQSELSNQDIAISCEAEKDCYKTFYRILI